MSEHMTCASPTEDKDQLLSDAANRIVKLEAALKRIRDCDLPGAKGWLYMQQIAKEALE